MYYPPFLFVVWMTTDLATAAAVAQLTGLALAALAICAETVTDPPRSEPEAQSQTDAEALICAAADRRVRFALIAGGLCLVLLVLRAWRVGTTYQRSRG